MLYSVGKLPWTFLFKLYLHRGLAGGVSMYCYALRCHPGIFISFQKVHSYSGIPTAICSSRVHGNLKCGNAYFYYFSETYLSLTFCCHPCFLRSVFTTHLRLPTWTISLAGDIYIVSNLNISVCAYYSETGSSPWAMGNAEPWTGLKTQYCTQSIQALKLPTLLPSLHSQLPTKLKLSILLLQTSLKCK